MKTLLDVSGAIEEPGMLAMIKFQDSVGMLTLHNFPRLEVSDPDNEGNLRVLIVSGLRLIGLHSCPPNMNLLGYNPDNFQPYYTRIGTRFMLLKGVFMESGSRTTFSPVGASNSFVLGIDDASLVNDLPELLFHLGVPKGDTPLLTGMIIQKWTKRR